METGDKRFSPLNTATFSNSSVVESDSVLLIGQLKRILVMAAV